MGEARKCTLELLYFKRWKYEWVDEFGQEKYELEFDPIEILNPLHDKKFCIIKLLEMTKRG